MHITITIWALLAALRWGDWKHLYEYHTTMLYMSTMNLLYFFLTFQYPLWEVQAHLIPSYTIVSLLYTFIVFPCTVILFLSNYPTTSIKKWIHIGKWIAIYIGIEWIGGLFGLIIYHHGWNLSWSLIFLCIMFPMLRLHHRRPYTAYLVSIFIIISLMLIFNVQ